MRFYAPYWRIRAINWLVFDWLVRASGKPILARLCDYENPVLVGGCQRSGTTAVTKVLSHSPEICTFDKGIDNELDGALILSGHLKHTPNNLSRYCFQVTYLNERLCELYNLQHPIKMVWVVRNPWSVVHSMVYNWRSSALNQLYRSCVAIQSDFHPPDLPKQFRGSRLQRNIMIASFCYCVRSSQLIDLVNYLPRDNLLVIDYDQLVTNPKNLLPEIFNFTRLTFQDSQIEMINKASVHKASNSLEVENKMLIEKLCGDIYRRCLEIVSIK